MMLYLYGGGTVVLSIALLHMISLHSSSRGWKIPAVSLAWALFIGLLVRELLFPATPLWLTVLLVLAGAALYVPCLVESAQE